MYKKKRSVTPGPCAVGCLRFPGGCREVSEACSSYESTRRATWPANSFMVSVTDPIGAPGCVLAPLRVNST
ncbi:hypothetical protein DCW30_26290 [Streptomyces alfalfae]|nr:hypothetical protein D3X13_07370 [Streptomyces fradiae]RXX39538.1 hypothetical protein DCW30_26290 [Streptomyces alfalfae]RZM94031.1 hypothetical protein D4104_19040 [Streptomyces alfalfae]